MSYAGLTEIRHKVAFALLVAGAVFSFGVVGWFVFTWPHP